MERGQRRPSGAGYVLRGAGGAGAAGRLKGAGLPDGRAPIRAWPPQPGGDASFARAPAR
jgi:hypothetical protein